MKIDAKAEVTLDELKDKLGLCSRIQVMRTAVALLKVALEARDQGLKIVLSDADNVVKKEILLT